MLSRCDTLDQPCFHVMCVCMFTYINHDLASWLKKWLLNLMEKKLRRPGITKKE